MTLASSLLSFTLRNAWRLEFYRQFWSLRDSPPSTWSEFESLPSLSKQEYRAGLMLNDPAVDQSDFVSHTTGTTGRMTWRHRTFAEAEVIASLFGSSLASSNDVTVSIRYNRHGMELPVPGGSRVVPVSLAEDVDMEQFLDLLATAFPIRGTATRPTALAAGSDDLALLSQALLERGLVPTRTQHIRTMMVGGYLALGRRKLVERAFPHARIVEKYSLAEIFGGATRAESGVYTADPHVIAEVLNDEDRPVDVGTLGELVLTELFPFVQMQPLIRYRTGDLVRHHGTAPDGRLRFEWWGRRQHCAVDPGSGRWAIGERPLLDWLSLDPLAASSEHRPQISNVGSHDVGVPVCALTTHEDVVRVTVGLRVSPWAYEAEVAKFVQRLWGHLQAEVAGDRATKIQLELCHSDFKSFARPQRASRVLPVSRLGGFAPIEEVD